MPLPRYQPVAKKPRVMAPSLDDLDDSCLSRIIGYALQQARARKEEPFVGDNSQTERNLSLVSRRWYFLTQTQVSDHGVHKIHLDSAALKADSNRKFGQARQYMSASKTPRSEATHATNYQLKPRTQGAVSTNRLRMRHNGILSQRNLFPQSTQPASKAEDGTCTKSNNYDLRLFRAIQPKLLKYKHIQLSGSLVVDNFDKLLIALNAARTERLDLLRLRIESAQLYSTSKGIFKTTGDLAHLQTLTYTWSNDPKDDASNALLWSIYERATNLHELQVYLIDISSCNNPGGTNSNNDSDSVRSIDSTGSVSQLQSAMTKYNGKWAKPVISRPHPRLFKINFNRVAPPACEPPGPTQVINCDYSILIKRILAEERSIRALDTNDCSLIEYLIQASGRVCTRHELDTLKLSHPIKSLDQLQHLMRLQNLGTDYLSIVIDNIELIGEVKALLESNLTSRPDRVRYQLNLHLRDQKHSDCEDKVKHLINLCRMADVNVYISALQRVSIDCCHLMWSTGRALQAITNDSPGKCIFRITLQTYPAKANTVNPCEITVPFGKCSQYKISSIKEDVTRHREIMRALKRDCYHQFVKSVREN